MPTTPAPAPTTESGPYSVDTWLELYAAHCVDHADQLAAAARD